MYERRFNILVDAEGNLRQRFWEAADISCLLDVAVAGSATCGDVVAVVRYRDHEFLLLLEEEVRGPESPYTEFVLGAVSDNPEIVRATSVAQFLAEILGEDLARVRVALAGRVRRLESKAADRARYNRMFGEFIPEPVYELGSLVAWYTRLTEEIGWFVENQPSGGPMVTPER